MESPTANLGLITLLMMRSAHYKKLPLSDIEKVTLPPLNNRLAVTATEKVGADGKPGGSLAFALFARVSDQWNRRLRDPKFKLSQLPPDAWTSGDILWLVDMLSIKQASPAFIDGAAKAVFPDGGTLNIRTREADGSVGFASRSF